jgi:hypothetical protein
MKPFTRIPLVVLWLSGLAAVLAVGLAVMVWREQSR